MNSKDRIELSESTLKKKVEYLESVLLERESEFHEEKTSLQRKIKTLEFVLKETRSKYRKMKQETQPKTENSSDCDLAKKFSEVSCSLNEKLLQISELELLLQEKDEKISLYKDQLDFIKKELKESEEKNSSFSIEYIKISFIRLMSKLPILSDEIESMINILTKILGISVIEKQNILNQRKEYKKIASESFQKIVK